MRTDVVTINFLWTVFDVLTNHLVLRCSIAMGFEMHSNSATI